MSLGFQVFLFHMAHSDLQEENSGERAAENDWSLWVATRLAVGIGYSSTPTHSLHIYGFTLWDISVTGSHYLAKVKLRNDISED